MLVARDAVYVAISGPENITDDQASVSCDDRHIRSRGAPPCSCEATKQAASTCQGSLAKTDATDFRTGGRWIDGTVCTQVRKTHWVRGVGLRLSEHDEFRDFSALAPGGFRLMPATGHCRQLGCRPHLGAFGANYNSPSPHKPRAKLTRQNG